MKQTITTAQYWKAKAKLAGFRSGEELWFKYWLDELEQRKLVYNVQYEPYQIELCRKAKYKKQETTKKGELIFKTKSIPYSAHSYKPDFIFCSKDERVRNMFIIADHESSEIVTDIKGGFSKWADEEGFPIKQAWVFQLYNVWVNKVIPDELFKKTFVPDKLRNSPKTGKPLQKYKKFLTVNEWLKG